jgi:hypothetical protein
MKEGDVPHFIEWLKLISSTATPLVLFFLGILARNTQIGLQLSKAGQRLRPLGGSKYFVVCFQN